ncbi:hypothetical protein JYB64_20650 [Algoriphagus aestuarii]|nr:hypothetical protein [Algoriphagus aestuarii]
MSEKMQTDEDLDLELMNFFFNYFENSRKEVTEHPEYNIGKNNYHLLSNNAKEASRILTFMGKIFGLNSDLEKTYTFIRRFPIKDYYQKNDIDQLEFIKYHYEVFIHKIHTLLEVKKLWLNDFYEIGLKEEDCNWNKLKTYSKIQMSPAKIIIENYFKSFKHIIEFRHLNTHRAFYMDSDIESIKIDQHIYNVYDKYKIDIPDDYKTIRPRFVVDYQIKKYRKEKLEYIKNGVRIAEIYSHQLITEILKEFFNKILKDEKDLAK